MSENVSVIGPISSGVAVGNAGAATKTGETLEPVIGCVVGIYVKYLDSPPAATTDVTVRTKGTSPAIPSTNLLVVTNSATDAMYYPKAAVQDAAAAAITGQYISPVVHDIVEIVIAGADAADYVLVWLYVI